MRITRNGGHISIRDQPGLYWFLGLFLLTGGVIGVAMPLGLATDTETLGPGQRLASVLIGLGVGAGALWWLWRNPGSQVQLDLTRRHLRLVRFGLSGRHVRRIRFEDLESVEVEDGMDSDGDPVWRPAVRLETGELVLLSQLWSHDRAGLDAALATVAEACRLPGLAQRIRGPLGGSHTG
jgi:hypothetical protein